MSAAAKATLEEAPADGMLRISEIPGAGVPITACRWEPGQQASNAHLLLLLGTATGRLDVSGAGNYIEREQRTDWPALRDLPEAAVEGVCSRIRAAHPEWQLEGGDGETLLDRLDSHFAAAQRRRALL